MLQLPCWTLIYFVIYWSLLELDLKSIQTTLPGYILEIKGMDAIFQEKGKEMWKKGR